MGKSFEVRYSADGSIHSRHWKSDEPQHWQSAFSYEVDSRAHNDAHEESGNYKDYGGFRIQGSQHGDLIPAEYFIEERCEWAADGTGDFGGKNPMEWGDSPQRVVEIRIDDDGFMTTSSYWIGDRDYEMSKRCLDRIELGSHNVNWDTPANIQYRGTHQKKKGSSYLEPDHQWPEI